MLTEPPAAIFSPPTEKGKFFPKREIRAPGGLRIDRCGHGNL
jgi:hypothetical protein